MIARRIAVFAAFAAGFVCGQDNHTENAFEIRGVVSEVGLDAGVAGAQITLYQFAGANRERTVFGTAIADGRGAFEFHPNHEGDFYVETKKPEYVATISPSGPTTPLPEQTGTLVSVSRTRPQVVVRLDLMRLAELTGRVTDEDGRPASGLALEALHQSLQRSSFQSLRALARTGADGVFKMAGVTPGQYVVRISVPRLEPPPPTPEFSDAELNQTDQEFETSYWPGVLDAAAAASVTIQSGASMNLGTLRVRQGTLYRARVSIRGCRPEDHPEFAVIRPDGVSLIRSAAGCGDFLAKQLPPGSYEFVLQSQQGWAMTPVEIGNKNLAVTLAVTPDSQISGRIMMAEKDAALPALNRVRVTLETSGPFTQFGFGSSAVSTRADGTFVWEKIKWSRHTVGVSGLAKGYYVKEIRANGIAAPDGVVTLGEGSQVEVVIDDHPAVLTGSVEADGKPVGQPRVYATPWPISSLRPRGSATSDENGRFQIGGLPPGEYRVLAVPLGTLADALDLGDVPAQLWDRAETVTLERGKVKELALKLLDAAR